MITFVKHHDINKKKWDECVLNSQYPLVYAESWYLDAVSPNWDAYVLEKDNCYTAVFPLTQRRKYGVTYLPQPPFCQQLGLFSSEKVDLNSFLARVIKQYPLIQISLNHDNYLNIGDNVGEKRINLELNLNRTYEDIFTSYNYNRKRDLKKAKKAELFIEPSLNIDFFIDFFQKEKKLFISGLGDKYWKVLRQIHQRGVKKSAIKLIFAYNSTREVVASGLYLVSNKRIIFLLGTSSAEGQENGGMTFLMDSVIHEYCLQDMVLDFEGSMIPGVAKFYESLGGKEKKYISLKASRLAVLLKILKKIKDFKF